MADRVKLHSLLSVVSSKPIQPGIIHRLSLLDQSMPLHTLHFLFYYRSNPFLAGHLPTDVDNLRVSLSRLLDDYPLATGRLARGSDGGWIVKFNDAGVRMVHAAVDATLDEWLRSADVDEEKDLTAWEDMPLDPNFWSPFRIQINNFKCGGLGLGLSCTHMHADFTSATHLIKSWAEVHCGVPISLSPNFCVPTSSSQNSSSSFRLSPIPVAAPSKMGTVTFKFPDHAIKKCLSQVQAQYPNVTSPFDILSALFWSRIARMQERSLSPNRTLSICTDMRSSTVPSSFFGNAIHFSELDVNVDALLNGELGSIADHIHRHVEGVKADDFGSVTQWLEDHHGKELRKGQPFKVYAPRLMCLSMEHMVDEEGRGLMYGAVFDKEGGNCPVHVSCRVGGVEGEGLIIVMASGEGGVGRNVTVTLPENHIDELCKDEGVVELEPSMALSGTRK